MRWCAISLLLTALAGTACAEPVKNGFDLAAALVPPEAIASGGPPRDGIPAIDRPRFAPAADVKFLRDEERVLGVSRNGIAKAYPVRILNWHEIVNDSFGTERVVVTYCPLCGTGMAYLAEVGGRRLGFGVSGLLYNSDVLLYDRETRSLWSQLLSQAVSGPMKGTRLTVIPLAHTSWSDWRTRHPETLVLTPQTGYVRDYERDPYAGYERSAEIWFGVQQRSDRYHPKELVIGLEINGRFKAYPFTALERAAAGLRDVVGGRAIVVRFDARHRTGAVYDAASDEEIPAVIAYWFAWYAFHPETELFEGGS
jgi:hypothetical protein